MAQARKEALQPLDSILDQVPSTLDQVMSDYRAQLLIQEVGTVTSVGQGVARVRGLPRVRSEELIHFGAGLEGMAHNLDPSQLGVILLSEASDLRAGGRAYRTGRVLDTPVGDALLGRVVDALGDPIDEQGPLDAVERRPVERPAPSLMDRAPVSEPLQTGIKVIDA